MIVPRADRTGPTNVAVDIGRAATDAGWQVGLLYLSGIPSRNDLGSFIEVRRWRLRDLWSLDGVVHTHGLRPDLVGWLISWTHRCRIVTTLHGHFPQHLSFDYAPWKVRLAWGLWSRALRRFDLRVCISKTMLRHYERSVPRQRFTLAYNFRSPLVEAGGGLSVETLQWFERQRAANRVVLVYVGSLTDRKNISTLVHEVSHCPELALVVCGQGPLSSALAFIVKDAATDAILLAGQLASPEKAVALSDVLVLPSHAEGLPLVVLEAARAGVPSLLSNITIHRELAAAGLGTTFDRHSFRDFRAKAIALARGRSGEADENLMAVWRERFSPEEGFSRYEQLLLSLDSNA